MLMTSDLESTPADRTIAALRSHHDDLAARVRGFDDADLARQSGAADWDVAGVLSHLGSGGAEIMLAGLQAGVAGKEPPGSDFAPAVWDRWNAMGPRERAKGFLESNERLVAALESLDATVRQEVRVKLGFLPEPADVTLLSGLRLSEAALHAWDVKVAFDPQATVTNDDTDLVLRLVTGPLSFMFGFLARGEAPSATLRIETADPDLVLGLVLGDAASLGAAPAQADGVLAGPAEAILRLVYGRLGEAHTPDDLTLTSDTITLDQLRAAFPGI